MNEKRPKGSQDLVVSKDTTEKGDERVLLLKGSRRADSLRSVLTEAGLSVLLCSDEDALYRAAQRGISVPLLAPEDSDAPATISVLISRLQQQPQCSDIPILALVSEKIASGDAAVPGNVLFLTEPLSAATLASATRFALRTRRGQVESAQGLAHAGRDAVFREGACRFEMIFERAAMGIALSDINGTLLLVNRTFGEMLGYLPNELKGRSLREMIHPEDLTNCEAHSRRLLNGSLDSYSLEKRLVRRDGEALWVELTCSTVPAGAGEPGAIVTVAEDITDHRRAQEALRISEERLRLAADAAHIGIWQWEMADGRQQWDTRCKALFGLSPETPVSFQTWRNALHPDDRQRMAHETTLFLSGYVETKEYRVVWPDGSVHWLLARGTAHFDRSGQPQRMIGIVMDITDRKKAEEALRLGEERLRLAAEAAGIGIWQWNVNEDRLLWDERCATLFGHPHLNKDATLSDLLALLHPEDRARILRNLSSALQRPEINTEIRTSPPNGAMHWLLVRGKTQFDEQGQPLRMNGIIMDVTSAKMTEELLQKAMEAAETASRTKSEFLANISHEIRTPMTVAMGAHELLQESALEDDQRQYLEMAQVALSTLLRLIDEILDFSRLESGKMLFEVESFDLHTSLREAVDAFQLEAGRKGLELHLEIGNEVPRIVRGDAARLRQVLTNLIGNAVKFTQEGSVRVTAAVTTREGKKERLLFSVYDTGIGISADKQHLLFQSFSQLDSSHTRRYGGTGIGLALSRRIVERLGGEICMESEPGKGSAFHFTIPLERPAWAWAQASAESEQRAPEAFHAAQGESPRILMAEDDPMLRELLGIILGNRHWNVEEARNGREALAISEHEKFDLILMDVQMPEMDGLEATRAIRKREKETASHIPIIAMTAHVREEDRRRCLEAGMDDYLSKPVQMSELYAKLEKYLGTKH